MSDYKLTIGPHPAQARHPITNEPLEKDGQPVPLFADQFSIRLDGKIIAYVLPGNRVAFLIAESKLGSVIVNDSLALVEKEFGSVAAHVSPPIMPDIEPDEDDE